MNEPKPLPSETKLVETPKKKYRQCLLCQCIGPECLIDGLKRDRDKAESALASLADELRLAREDARRYRWLRHADDQDWNELMRDGGEQLDIAIDKAMKEPR